MAIGVFPEINLEVGDFLAVADAAPEFDLDFIARKGSVTPCRVAKLGAGTRGVVRPRLLDQSKVFDVDDPGLFRFRIFGRPDGATQGDDELPGVRVALRLILRHGLGYDQIHGGGALGVQRRGRRRLLVENLVHDRDHAA